MRRKSVKKVLAGLCAGMCLAALLTAGAGCGAHQDVVLARRILKQLVDGHYGARHWIDWEKLVAMGQPVGQIYSGYKGEADRLGFQRGFIDSFRDGFRAQGSSFKDFTNWRVLDRDKETSLTRVVTDIKDHPELFLLFVFETQKGKKRLVTIAAQKIVDPEQFKEYESQARHDH